MILRIEVNEDTFYLLSCCQRITNKANFHIYNWLQKFGAN